MPCTVYIHAHRIRIIRLRTFRKLVAGEQAPAVDVRSPDLKPVARWKRLELSVLRLWQVRKGRTRRSTTEPNAYIVVRTCWCQVSPPQTITNNTGRTFFFMVRTSMHWALGQAQLEETKAKVGVSRVQGKAFDGLQLGEQERARRVNWNTYQVCARFPVHRRSPSTHRLNYVRAGRGRGERKQDKQDKIEQKHKSAGMLLFAIFLCYRQ